VKLNHIGALLNGCPNDILIINRRYPRTEICQLSKKRTSSMDGLPTLHWTFIGGGIYLLVCGGFASLIAYQKRRSIFEGFLVGFFLGPIGIVWEMLRWHGARAERARKKKDEADKEIFRQTTEHYRPRPRKSLGDDDRRPNDGV
jgi:hypothetical protein